MSRQQSDAKIVLFGGIEVDISQFDFNDHSSRVASVKIANIIFIALVLTTVALRIFARVKYVRRIFADDILIIFAAVFTVALALTCIAATAHGLGQHVWILPVQTLFETMKSCILYLYVCQVLYAFSIALTKIAIISSYLRFIQDKPFRLAMYITSIIIASLWVTGVFVTIFQCRPISGAWNFTISRKCVDYIDYLYASSAVNVATDIILCILPLPHLWRLNMPLKQRLILCALLAGGASACVVGMVRIGYLHHLRVLDLTYQSVPCLILSVGECSLGIITVSIPPLRPLARRFFPSAMRSNPSTSSQPRTWHVRLSSIPPSQNRTPLDAEVKHESTTSYESSHTRTSG
ncbi:hypothetical protein BDW02DRAFT_493764 [Decorospora gaudefroyi]|uniref:Rhodopsin domain-containing protein n=1 Tax=Decorospora gaudefroyi TaxID=184978 RepID=A0A6A5KE31_9PLEO|nr:hypothetical protein BDW02DRAFT_493764 [Decorospora gaudefroyi]